jgi:hypothetical protein
VAAHRRAIDASAHGNVRSSMDVVSTGHLPVASLVWQPRPGAWVLTVVSKATYVLRPGECPLAPTQEPPADDDRHLGDDPARSLRCPRDLVPVKPGADVILVGNAFAPEGRPARSVSARLSVGEIDKTIEVMLDRSVRLDGRLLEGQPFVKMPLAYERAGGGPGTWNPVGMPRDARDAAGGMVLPNLQRPGASIQNVFDPVGFGPIAPSWPERRDRLGPAGAGWSFRDLGQRPLPEGMDPAFFNAAPRDQQLRALSERLSVTLENLHPDHPRLTTTIPATAPRAVLEGRREGPLGITLRADTLWIDTDSALCTVTFRGMVPLQGADERGRIVVSSERAPPEVGRADEPSGVARGPRQFAMTADIPLEVRQAGRAALPFAHTAPAQAPAPPAVVVARAPEAPAVAPSPAAAHSPWATGGLPAEAAALAAPVVARASAASAPSVFDASTAAAGEPRAVPRVEPRTAAEPEPAPAPRAEVQEAIDLVWFDPESVRRIRRKAEWRPLLDALERTPLDPDFDDPAFAKDPMSIEDRREVFEILAHAAPTSAEGLDAALAGCLRDDGKFVPALALFSGELEMPFDELSSLRATLTTVSPLAGSDEALRGAVQAAKDFLATPGLMSAPAVAEGLTRRIEDAFAQGKRVVPAGYLEAQRERALLEQRQYQRRSVLGAKHLRGLMKLSGAEPAPRPAGPGKAPPAAVIVPTYLPEALAELLPMAPRFRARMVAELRLSADRHENHAGALRVIALARVSSPPRA